MESTFSAKPVGGSRRRSDSRRSRSNWLIPCLLQERFLSDNVRPSPEAWRCLAADDCEPYWRASATFCRFPRHPCLRCTEESGLSEDFPEARQPAAVGLPEATDPFPEHPQKYPAGNRPAL